MSLSLHRVLYQLRNGNRDLHRLLRKYNNADWGVYTRYNKYKYSPHTIYEDKEVVAKIITWLPTQQTSVHGHPHYNSCYYKVLIGQLTEYLYNKENLDLFKTNIYRQDDIGQCKKNYFHKILNNDNNLSVSLHLYTKNDYDDSVGVLEIDEEEEVMGMVRRLI